MRTFSNGLLLLFLLSGCSKSGKSSTQTESDGLSNIIDLTSGLNNIQTIRLSEIADSVTFIPFETTPQSLQGQGQKNLIKFSPSYIYYFGMCFDWTGKFYGAIIKRGQGPYEEIDSGDLLFVDNRFYSKGSKFIEYDMTGMPTGKVRNLYAARESETNDFLRRGSGFSSVGENFVVYNFPTTLYYFNRNFETIASRVVFSADSLPPHTSSIGDSKYITYYKEKVLFFNFLVNDTIFYVTDTGLNPIWVVNFDDRLRLLSQTIFLFPRDFIGQVARGDLSSAESSEYAKQTDHKHKVIAAYETDKYIFFQMTEIIQLAPLRGKQAPDPYIIYYDKVNGKTTRVNGKGFVDDILGMDSFYPQLGIFDEKMITYIWPYELLSYIDECREKGRVVNPQLLALSKRLKEDDNPILILFHLKK